MQEKMKRFEPTTEHEKAFCRVVEMYKGIGYGQMKQLITGIWAKELMETGLPVETSLLGALDFETWANVKER